MLTGCHMNAAGHQEQPFFKLSIALRLASNSRAWAQKPRYNLRFFRSLVFWNVRQSLWTTLRMQNRFITRRGTRPYGRYLSLAVVMQRIGPACMVAFLTIINILQGWRHPSLFNFFRIHQASDGERYKRHLGWILSVSWASAINYFLLSQIRLHSR